MHYSLRLLIVQNKRFDGDDYDDVDEDDDDGVDEDDDI